ncbi:phage head completion protein [Kineosporia succinea]|uniref:Head-tail adaptor n=1 Tax=Kineosporia succinea TaxID=84632 RepID=A0ABT9NYK8_9ACTN|nr:head-tail adaptor protein [Kineosporia succinea]MDP9825224.1 head-tail adaptor [Kineosporia succinea]
MTILTAPLVAQANGYGGKKQDWSNAVETMVAANVQPATTSELLESSGSRDQVVTRYKVWFPAGTSVTATSRLRWNGLLLSVDGQPQVWHDAWGTPDHVEVLAVVSAG